MKFTSTDVKFNLDKAREKAISDIAPISEGFGDPANTRLIHVHITNRELLGTFDAMDSDDVIICRDNIAGFFTLGLVDRLTIAATTRKADPIAAVLA